ncbi:phage-like protein [Salmonella enterica subsp. arizonae]|nr:phage-like protein [Salmonella enterica subsp. arizonae]
MIGWFLQNEGSHDVRMNEMMSVAIPLDDSDGLQGRTVYARTDLAAFTVLGPYSGRLLDSEKVRCEYEKEYGRMPVIIILPREARSAWCPASRRVISLA